MTEKLHVIIEFVYPPVPSRSFDWAAYIDGTEESGRIGCGETKWAAVRELVDILEDAE